MSTKKLVIGGALLAVIVGGGTYLVIKQNNEVLGTSTIAKPEELTRFSHEPYGLSFDYSPKLTLSSLTADDEQANIIARIQNSEQENKKILITIRGEAGLRAPSQLSRLDVIDLVYDGAIASLPQRYPEPSIKSEKKYELNGREVQEIVFTYRHNQNEFTQQLTLMPIDKDRAVYVAMQSLTQDYESVRSVYFDQILNSIQLN